MRSLFSSRCATRAYDSPMADCTTPPGPARDTVRVQSNRPRPIVVAVIVATAVGAFALWKLVPRHQNPIDVPAHSENRPVAWPIQKSGISQMPIGLSGPTRRSPTPSKLPDAATRPAPQTTAARRVRVTLNDNGPPTIENLGPGGEEGRAAVPSKRKPTPSLNPPVDFRVSDGSLESAPVKRDIKALHSRFVEIPLKPKRVQQLWNARGGRVGGPQPSAGGIDGKAQPAATPLAEAPVDSGRGASPGATPPDPGPQDASANAPETSLGWTKVGQLDQSAQTTQASETEGATP